LQTIPVEKDLLSAVVNNRLLAASPVVCIEPLRRKFHRPITVTVPITGYGKRQQPQGKGLGRVLAPHGQLRLVCSVSGNNNNNNNIITEYLVPHLQRAGPYQVTDKG